MPLIPALARPLTALALGLLLAACRGQTPPAEAPAERPASAPDAAPISAAPSAADPLPSPPERVAEADTTRLFSEARVSLPPPLAGVTFAQNRAQLTERFGAALSADGQLSLPELAELPVRLGFHGGTDRLRFIQLTVPDSLMAGLIRRWGEPQKARLSPARDGLWWLGDGIQALFETRPPRHYLTFWPLTPWRDLIGTTRGRPGFQRDTPLLGAPAADIARAFADAHPKHSPRATLELALPPHERLPRPTPVKLSLDGADRITAVTLSLTYADHLPTRDAIFAHLDAHHGPFTVEGDRRTTAGLTVEDRPLVGRLRLTWAAP